MAVRGDGGADVERGEGMRWQGRGGCEADHKDEDEQLAREEEKKVGKRRGSKGKKMRNYLLT